MQIGKIMHSTHVEPVRTIGRHVPVEIAVIKKILWSPLVLLLAAAVGINTVRKGSRQLQVETLAPVAIDEKAVAERLAGPHILEAANFKFERMQAERVACRRRPIQTAENCLKAWFFERFWPPPGAEWPLQAINIEAFLAPDRPASTHAAAGLNANAK